MQRTQNDGKPGIARMLSSFALLGALIWIDPAVAEPAMPLLPVDDGSASLEATMRGDAALADVFFLNHSIGWACGDRGAVWHTADGGQSWTEQQSGTNGLLNSIFFIDEHQGWAAGGVSLPHERNTRGILLRTTDGGRTWSQMANLLLPALERIKFFGPQQGIAFGVGSSVLPSGAFSTTDGGQNWQPLVAGQHGYWLAGDFVDFQTGALAGLNGQIATVLERRISHSPLAALSARSSRAMRLVEPTAGWIVGDGGLVMQTADLGRSWQTTPTALPEYVADHFDFRTVAVVGSHVWIAGSPGTRVFHSADGGRSWDAFATGHSTPLHAITFADDMHGWAVGDLGTILATHDGGQSWAVQHAGGRRAALLAVFARGLDVPLELLAEQGAAEGYLTAVDLLLSETQQQGATRDESFTAERLHEAFIRAGATATESAWRYPLPSAELALSGEQLWAALDRANDGRARERLVRRLVRQMRMWRPEVVVTHTAGYEQADPLAAKIRQLLDEAIAAAADPTQYVELATDVGLGPWRVKRLVGVLPADARGDQTISTGQFVPRLGRTLADWTAPARRLLATSYETAPTTIELDLQDIGSGGEPPRNLFFGIALSPGGEARRPLAPLPVDSLEQLRQMAQKRRNMQQLLEHTEGNTAWAGQIADLTDGLDVEGGGELLFQLAAGYQAKGRLDLAADTYFLFVRRYPEHPLVNRALVWLVQFYASSEATRVATIDVANNSRQLTGDSSEHTAGAVRQASATLPIAGAPPAVALSRDERLQRAIEIGKFIEASRPALHAEPAVQFPLIVAQRALGFTNPAKKYFLRLEGLPESDPWRACAESEKWLSNSENLPPPKSIGLCRLTTERPHLDGQLDEPFWRAADALPLAGVIISESSSATQPAGAEVRLSRDDKYLYLAIRCPMVAGVAYEPDDRPRPRDADLVTQDRVAIRLDVDRDYSTYFELVVDQRGWTNDRCWSDEHWNPQWFVAAGGDATAWTIEAAIPLAELTANGPRPRDVWAVAVRRSIPQVGFQSWIAGAVGDDSPEQFGLVIFQ